MDNLENLHGILETAKNLVKTLISNTHCEVNNLPATQGVYLICSRENQVIYVGKSKNLKIRIRNNHISGATNANKSAFRRQLVNSINIDAGIELKQWIIDNCSFSYIEISDYDMCNLVESLTISVLRSSGSDLLNHLVDSR